MGTFDPLTDHAMWVLSDMKDALSDGGALDGFVNGLIDEGADLKNIVRVLLSDGIEAQRLLGIKATHFAFAQARDYLEAREPTQDPHDTYGVSRGAL